MSVLAGRKVVLSISDAPDRGRLGFPDREIDRTVYSVCIALIRAGASILYSGDLRPEGFTFKIFRHLAGAYAGAGHVPFVHLVPEPVFRRTPFETWHKMMLEIRGTTTSQIVIGSKPLAMVLTEEGKGLLIDPDGDGRIEINSADEFSAWLAKIPVPLPQAAYSVARDVGTSMADARIALGGKMGLADDANDQYEGVMPGIAEEVLLALRAGKPVVCLGAFGGATRDIAIELGLLPLEARIPRGPQRPDYEPAIKEVGKFKGNIPEALKPRLAAIADDDHTEQLANVVVDVLSEWLARRT